VGIAFIEEVFVRYKGSRFLYKIKETVLRQIIPQILSTLLSKWLSVFSLKLMSGELPESFFYFREVDAGRTSRK
jgi:hypothetical protein